MMAFMASTSAPVRELIVLTAMPSTGLTSGAMC